MRAWIYDAAILPLTAKWYRQVLERLPDRSRVLDVGIGTGGALAKNARLVRDKALDVVGVDIDPDYVRRCKRRLEKVGLAGHVRVYLQPIEEHDLGPYDAAYFSASFMLLPHPDVALRHVVDLLAPGGRVYFTQTFEERKSALVEKAKPLLHKVTTIDFGHVTYEDDFVDVVESAGVQLQELTTIGKSGPRTFRLAVGVPNQPSL